MPVFPLPFEGGELRCKAQEAGQAILCQYLRPTERSRPMQEFLAEGPQPKKKIRYPPSKRIRIQTVVLDSLPDASLAPPERSRVPPHKLPELRHCRAHYLLLEPPTG